jgi:hypothetical protein
MLKANGASVLMEHWSQAGACQCLIAAERKLEEDAGGARHRSMGPS